MHDDWNTSMHDWNEEKNGRTHTLATILIYSFHYSHNSQHRWRKSTSA